MRVLTVPPTSDGWVVLPICRDRGVGYEGPHGIGCGCPSTTDVLGLVERCERCNRGARFGNEACWKCSSTGHLLTGFVKVVEVLPIVPFEPRSDDYPLIEVDAGNRNPILFRSAKESEFLRLPNAAPGGVAIRVEPCECPTCDGRGFTFAGPMLRGGPICPTCSDLPRPVTLHGDAPIQEVNP